jgi:pimeloyl-ACP methyl ester carboxylesterase
VPSTSSPSSAPRRSYASLAERDARRAFFCTLRAVIDSGGQTVSATDRLYLASHVPTLIVWGRRDTLIPVRHGVAAHEAIPGSRLEIFDDAGHFPHCETPERFLEAVVDFIDATESARVPEQYWRELLRRRADASASGYGG